MEDLLALWDKPLVKAVLGIAVFGYLFKLIFEHFNKPKQSGLWVQIKCPSCGWSGQVGKYDMRCRKCGATDL